jgi:hypothetical protein
MRGNSHVRFLGEGVSVMRSPYPTTSGPSPSGTWPGWVERLEEIKAEFLAKAQEFLADYDTIREGWREKYPDI